MSHASGEGGLGAPIIDAEHHTLLGMYIQNPGYDNGGFKNAVFSSDTRDDFIYTSLFVPSQILLQALKKGGFLFPPQ